MRLSPHIFKSIMSFKAILGAKYRKNLGHGAMQKYLHGEVLKIMTAERGCM